MEIAIKNANGSLRYSERPLEEVNVFLKTESGTACRIYEEDDFLVVESEHKIYRLKEISAGKGVTQ